MPKAVYYSVPVKENITAAARFDPSTSCMTVRSAFLQTIASSRLVVLQEILIIEDRQVLI